MRTNNSGPPCPKPARVRELIEYVGNEIENLEPETIAKKEWNVMFRDLIDALDWLATSLENRTTYHKKQQLKNKALRLLAREHGLDDAANVMSEEMLHDFVSSQKPDADEIVIPDVDNTIKGDDNEV